MNILVTIGFFRRRIPICKCSTLCIFFTQKVFLKYTTYAAGVDQVCLSPHAKCLYFDVTVLVALKVAKKSHGL